MSMPLPLELLAEEKLNLQGVKDGTVSLPAWLTECDRPRVIEELEITVKWLEEHIAKHGNRWEKHVT
jgi:hypothetical protein